MITAGVLITLLGWITTSGEVETVGLLVLGLGLVLLIFSAAGHPVGRRNWY